MAEYYENIYEDKEDDFECGGQSYMFEPEYKDEELREFDEHERRDREQGAHALQGRETLKMWVQESGDPDEPEENSGQ